MAEGLGADICCHLVEKRHKLGGRVAGEPARKGGIEVVVGRGEHLTHALDPPHALPPPGATLSSRRSCRSGSASRRARGSGGRAPARRCQRRKAVRVVRQAEVRGHVRGATGPRLVPGNDGVLVREGGRLWLPHAAVHGRTVNEHQRPPFAQTLIGDLEPVRPNDLHRHNVHPSETDNFKPLREPRARSGAPSGALARRLSRRGGGHSGSTPARGQSGSPRIQQAPP